MKSQQTIRRALSEMTSLAHADAESMSCDSDAGRKQQAARVAVVCGMIDENRAAIARLLACKVKR